MKASSNTHGKLQPNNVCVAVWGGGVGGWGDGGRRGVPLMTNGTEEE